MGEVREKDSRKDNWSGIKRQLPDRTVFDTYVLADNIEFKSRSAPGIDLVDLCGRLRRKPATRRTTGLPTPPMPSL